MKFLKFLLFVLLIYSCEKDIISFESGVINSENAINFSTNQLEFSVKNNSENLNPIQSNGLPSYLLGVTTTLNLVQLIAVLLDN